MRPKLKAPRKAQFHFHLPTEVQIPHPRLRYLGPRFEIALRWTDITAITGSTRATSVYFPFRHLNFIFLHLSVRYQISLLLFSYFYQGFMIYTRPPFRLLSHYVLFARSHVAWLVLWDKKAWMYLQPIISLWLLLGCSVLPFYNRGHFHNPNNQNVKVHGLPASKVKRSRRIIAFDPAVSSTNIYPNSVWAPRILREKYVRNWS